VGLQEGKRFTVPSIVATGSGRSDFDAQAQELDTAQMPIARCMWIANWPEKHFL
jgi:hypothetical protein